METITFKGIELHVEGVYTKGDEGTMYHSDMSGTPPTSSEFEIKSIYVDSTDIYDLFDWDDISKIEELVLEKLE